MNKAKEKPVIDFVELGRMCTVEIEEREDENTL